MKPGPKTFSANGIKQLLKLQLDSRYVIPKSHPVDQRKVFAFCSPQNTEYCNQQKVKQKAKQAATGLCPPFAWQFCKVWRKIITIIKISSEEDRNMLSILTSSCFSNSSLFTVLYDDTIREQSCSFFFLPEQLSFWSKHILEKWPRLVCLHVSMCA